MANKREKMELKRALGTGLSTVFAVGLVLGAGIYSTIAGAVGGAGGLTWLLFAILPAIIYLFIGLTYAEFAAIYPTAGSAYVYAREGLSKVSKRGGNFVAFIMLFSGLFVAIPLAAAVVSLVFGQYLNEFLVATFGGGLAPISLGGILTINPPVIYAIILVVLLTIINWLGIKESAAAMVLGMVIEIAGLMTVAFIGFMAGAMSPDYLSTAGAPKAGVMGLVTAFAIGYFMYSGLELTPSLAEEARDPQKTIPRAIIFALTVVAVIYLLVALGIVRLLPLPAIAGSGAAFIDTTAVVMGIATATLLFAFFALFAGLNTVLAELVTSSRLMYGIAQKGALPSKLGKIGRRKTPTNAIIVAGVIAAIFCLFEQIQLVVEGAVVTICFIDFIVCVSLIASRRREPKMQRPFRVPLSVKNVPIPTLLAAIVTLILPMLLLLDNWITWIPFVASLPTAIIAYGALRRRTE